jgi:hypothetical protein
LAELEAEMGIQAIYFMMHKHELNEIFFDSPKMWDSLKKIQDYGHTIGLHLDLFDLASQNGSAIQGIQKYTQLFHDNGFDIKFVNRHGNTLHERYLRDMSWMISDLSHLNLPSLPKKYEIYQSSFSLDDLSNLSISTMVDSQIIFTNSKSIIETNYVTDNFGGLTLSPSRALVNTSRLTQRLKIDEKQLLHEPEIVQNIFKAFFSTSYSQVLIHPQLY